MNAVAESILTDEEREEAIRETVRAMAAADCREKRMELFHRIKAALFERGPRIEEWMQAPACERSCV